MESDDYVPRAEHIGTDADSRFYHGVSRADGCCTAYRYLYAHPAGYVLLDTGWHHRHLAISAHQSAEPHSAFDAGWRLCVGGWHHLGILADGQRHDEQGEHHRCQHPADADYRQFHSCRCAQEGQRL